ncbi:variable surface lipoprotein, partial [Mycoplasmopsis bovis]|uniref:variable surface lipoprotein n=1 Tax=Mycoplasmopsis bovis TaxID=28903 RepID=UPI003D265E42
MKKSKFLLLGSVASLASIPFIAAKCGETKEEKKPEVDKGDMVIFSSNPIPGNRMVVELLINRLS